MVAWKICLYIYMSELRKAPKLFPDLVLLINREINLQYTHIQPNSVSNQPTLIFLQNWSQLLSNGASESSSVLCGNLHPSAVKLEFDSKSLTMVGTSLLTWCLGTEMGMRWKKTSPVSLKIYSLSFWGPWKNISVLFLAWKNKLILFLFLQHIYRLWKCNQFHRHLL